MHINVVYDHASWVQYFKQFVAAVPEIDQRL